MTSRTLSASTAGRASSMRRLRRRASAAHRPYCATNGCATLLEIDGDAGVASCPRCGYRRRLG